MKHGLLAVLLAPCVVAPAAANPFPDPADPAAPVPPPAYRSVFNQTATGVETGATPWPRANADVGQFRRGHVDLLKWEQQQQPSAPAAPGATPHPPHVHHHPGGKP